jgi:hypothetical protein
MVTFRGNKHLGFMLEPAKGLAVEDAISIPLKLGTHSTWGLGALAAP